MGDPDGTGRRKMGVPAIAGVPEMSGATGFLASHGWATATASPLAGDASTRAYVRLRKGTQRAILMEAPIEAEADRTSYTAFRHIGAHLRTMGLSAPVEIAANPDKGLILMEDLGDVTLSYLLAKDQETAHIAYHAAAQLSYGDAPDLHTPDAAQMAEMVALTFSLLPNSDALRERLLSALTDALQTHAAGLPTLSLRDVHGDNLLWLPDRDGPARIGLLDYQDALMLPVGYDLASLLDDPRRVVPDTWREAFIAEFSTLRRINTLSLQRNLRILGIFHRLSTEFGKPGYAAFLPRTRALITRCADDLPTLRAPVAELLDRTADWGRV